MAKHPPWLRFSAYVVGLPKTGSTSVATMFGNYRTGHEWQLQELTEAGLARLAGTLTDEQFLAAAGPRLTSPALELDSTTSHHLYADLLRDQFPKAVFIHTVRDVGSWTTSLLDMVLRQRIGRAMTGIAQSPWENHYLSLVTEGAYDTGTAIVTDDHACLPALMRFWAEHMRTLTEVLPPERSLRVRTTDLRDSAPQLAALTGVPPQTIRADLSHANRAEVTLDRLAVFDSPEVRDAYREHCADIMVEVFPEAHARMFTTPVDAPDRAAKAAQTAWDRHVELMQAWVVDAVAEHAPGHLRGNGSIVAPGVGNRNG